jgi:hypothetical protein
MICLVFAECKSYEKEKALYAGFWREKVLHRMRDLMKCLWWIICSIMKRIRDKTSKLCVRRDGKMIFLTVKNQVYYLHTEFKEVLSMGDD